MAWVMWAVWVIVALVVLGFLKFEHYRKTGNVFLIIFILLLAYFSMNAMIKTGKMDFSSPKGVINSIAIYFGWLGETSFKLFDVGKDTVKLVGNAIKTNQTEESKKK